MTREDLEILLEHVADWLAEAQEELMHSIASIEEKHLGAYRLNEEEQAAVRRGLQEMQEGKFASGDKVAAVFNRYCSSFKVS